MKLETLLSSIYFKKIEGKKNIDITGIQIDSRKVKEGDLFVAIKGETTDGHLYIEKALEKGAVAVLYEEDIIRNINTTHIQVNSTRDTLPILLDHFFDSPTKKLTLIGITGTNGKTSTTNIISEILKEKEIKAGTIGTIKIEYGDFLENAVLTTPEASETQRHFREMNKQNITHAIMEVSSHSLDLGRTKTFDFDIGVFTNLSQDHLDYHETMEEYKKAKGLLFSRLVHQHKTPKHAVLNQDEEASDYYKKITNAQILTYGIQKEADVMAKNIHMTPNGMTFELATIFGHIQIETTLIGTFNVYNLLAAIAVCLIEGLTLEEIKRGVQKIKGIEGRMETVLVEQEHFNQPFSVIVDFAHTPDGLENLLSTVKEFAKGKVYTVVGCGGNRDTTKRPIMASIAEKYSDFVYLTSDNPRFENPLSILKDMEKGMKTDQYRKYIERKRAIEQAIISAEKDDCVVIAGKGHEKYQIIGNENLYHDDRELAKEVLQKVLAFNDWEIEDGMNKIPGIVQIPSFIPPIRFRDLDKWCKENGLHPGDLTEEQYEQFKIT